MTALLFEQFKNELKAEIVAELKKEMAQTKPVLNARELGDYLGLSYGTVRNKIIYEPQTLPPSVLVDGRRRMWVKKDVDAWIEGLKTYSKIKEEAGCQP